MPYRHLSWSTSANRPHALRVFTVITWSTGNLGLWVAFVFCCFFDFCKHRKLCAVPCIACGVLRIWPIWKYEEETYLNWSYLIQFAFPHRSTCIRSTNSTHSWKFLKYLNMITTHNIKSEAMSLQWNQVEYQRFAVHVFLSTKVLSRRHKNIPIFHLEGFQVDLQPPNSPICPAGWFLRGQSWQ